MEMKSKKTRIMTVTYASGHKNANVPMIRMQGAWLKELGFQVGDKIAVECRGGRIMITNGKDEKTLDYFFVLSNNF